MGKKPNGFLYVIGLLLLIVAGVVTTAIISSVKNNNDAPTDIRARAGVVNTLKLTGMISSVDTDNGVLVVDNVVFAPESRSGPEINYGTWIVIPPQTFSVYSAVPGSTIDITVNSASLDVASKQVAASQIVVRQ